MIRQEQQIFRLDRAVQGASGVRAAQRRGDLQDQRPHLARFEALALACAHLHDLAEREALDELHVEKAALAVVVDVEEADDVPVLQAAEAPDLLDEDAPGLRVGEERGLKDLERDIHAQHAIVRLVDGAEPAAGDHFLDLVARQDDVAGRIGAAGQRGKRGRARARPGRSTQILSAVFAEVRALRDLVSAARTGQGAPA